jgi:hypothetical protein
VTHEFHRHALRRARKGQIGSEGFARGVEVGILAFLSAVDFDGSRALGLRHTFGTITVKGKALSPVWDALREGTLCRVCENHAASSPEDPSVDTIALVDFTDAQQNEPVFPEGGI